MFRRAPKLLEMRDNLLLPDTAFRWEPGGFRLDQPGFERIPFEEIGLYRDAPFRP
jgi:hypothetical protein